MFCCTLLYVHSSIAIILMGKRELVALRGWTGGGGGTGIEGAESGVEGAESGVVFCWF